MDDEGNDPEIGRELLWGDLAPVTIVVVQPPGSREIAFTMWVRAKDDKTIAFHSNVKNWSVINFRGPDDTVVDDRGRLVRVYEYLGEP
jgi:hypothetical protein